MCTRICSSRARFWIAAGFMALCVHVITSSVLTAAGVPQTTKSWRVEGRVVDEKGEPVAGVDVFTNELPYLKSKKQSKTTTGSDGRFQLDIAPPISGRTVRASRNNGKQ